MYQNFKRILDIFTLHSVYGPLYILPIKSRLIQNSSFVVTVTRATTEWTQQMYLKKLHRLIDTFFVSTLYIHTRSFPFYYENY